MNKEILYISISGFIIQFSFLKKLDETRIFMEYFIALIKHYYKNFLIEYTGKKIDFTVEVQYHQKFHIAQKKKNKEIFINFYTQISSKKIKTYYHISAMQLEIIIRNIVYELLQNHFGFILHGSGVYIEGKAYIFLGNSGAGKSSISKLLSSQGTPFGDDTVILKRENNTYYCYATTSVEKNFWILKNSKKIPLGRIFFLQKSNRHTMTSVLNKKKIMPLLTKQVYTEEDKKNQVISNVMQFVNSFDQWYFLQFGLKNSDALVHLITKKDGMVE